MAKEQLFVQKVSRGVCEAQSNDAKAKIDYTDFCQHHDDNFIYIYTKSGV